MPGASLSHVIDLMRKGFPMKLYSPHFTRRELLSSAISIRLGIENAPDQRAEQNLVYLCGEILERIRDRFGPLRIVSGYRSPLLNAAIRCEPMNAHSEGRAVDFEPVNSYIKCEDVISWIIHDSGFALVKVDYEFGEWIHLEIPPQMPAANGLPPGVLAPKPARGLREPRQPVGGEHLARHRRYRVRAHAGPHWSERPRPLSRPPAGQSDNSPPEPGSHGSPSR
jgi:hypothetical protein